MPRASRHTEDQVRAAVQSAHSVAEALRHLGLRPAGGNHKTLKKLIERYGISTEHFDPYRGQRGHRRLDATPLEAILVEDSTYSRNHLKRRLYDEGLKRRVCELCGQGEEWRSRQMALILDHINGKPTDNRLENLQVVVPELRCDSRHTLRTQETAVTYAASLPLVHDRVHPKYATHRYCSPACGIQSRSEGAAAGAPQGSPAGL